MSTERQHSSLLPLDRHPTWLCLDIMKFSLFNGGVKFSTGNPPSWMSKNFKKKLCISILIYIKQPNQVQLHFVLDFNLLHHYLIYIYKQMDYYEVFFHLPKLQLYFHMVSYFQCSSKTQIFDKHFLLLNFLTRLSETLDFFGGWNFWHIL